MSRAVVVLLVLVVLMATAYTSPVHAGRLLRGCPCGETYMVHEGESLQSISQKCNDPFVVEGNPQLELEDVVPGQLLRVQCSQRKISLCDIAGALPIRFCK